MPRFVATTARGLVEPLEQELKELGFKTTDTTISSVGFETNWAGCYRANLQSRIASRILYSVLDFTAYNPEEYYSAIRKHDFTKYIDIEQGMMVEASVRECTFRDQRLLAMKTKDAIVDQFRDATGDRPNVDHDNAVLRVYVRGVKNNYNVSIDTTGDSLFKRGYRKGEQVDAPLKEHLAAGLLRTAGFTGQMNIVDPFCGSGTLLIEAALIARQLAPGTMRKSFVCQKLKNFQEEAWDKEVDVALSAEVHSLPVKFYGFDISGRAIKVAKRNAAKAGVDDLIEFHRMAVSELRPPCKRGMIVTNPPYGLRVGGEAHELTDTYKDFSFGLKEHFNGWDAWVLSGNKELSPALKLKASRRMQVFNGPLECRFLKYQIK